MSEVVDAETVAVNDGDTDRPVDPPDEPRTVYATLTLGRDHERRPIVPAWVRNRRQRLQVAAWLLGHASYTARFHCVRLPKYAAKTALWAPVGVYRTGRRVHGWATDPDGARVLMRTAVTRGDHETWLRLSKARLDGSRSRWAALAGTLLFLAVATVLAARAAPLPARWALVAGVTVLLARAGRPADRPITDRVSAGGRFTKLTAEMVRTALVSVGLAGLRDPAAVTFPAEIHRDGPGYLARVNLPLGVEAVDVMERRGKLSSALRLPVDQVWPAAGPDHAGQLDLWVGYQPASKMGQPRWALCRDGARTSVFADAPFGTDPRQRPVSTVLFARNFILGGQPGSGKSYAARVLALIAALDPTCELKIAEFKGTADFGDLADLCTTYVCGVDDEALQDGADMIAWGLAEAERRGKRIRAARERGEAPEGKVTPELAARPGSGLHPVLILVDEAHELLCDKDVAAAAERLIKRGRALGLIIVLATQIPDKSSLPPNITRCVNVRWCLAVQDQVANDMILGTGAYKRGLTATVFRPGADAGWGVMTGLESDRSVRSYYPSPADTARVIARATALRGGTVTGEAELPTVRLDVLRDVARVFGGRPGLHWQRLAELLEQTRPELYTGMTPDALSALVRAEGPPSVDVNISGRVLKGVRLDAVRAALASREIE